MYIDTHSHLNLEQFAGDFAEVIENMREREVRTQTVGVDVESSARAIQLSLAYPDISRALVGIHPAYLEPDQNYHQDLIEIRNMITSHMCVGVGECGFDYFRCEKSKVHSIQRLVFEGHIQMASESEKPLMLHLRPSRGTYDAYDDALMLLDQYCGKVVGQAHFFAGTIDQARTFLDLGFYISCTGVITFTHDYDELIRFVPIDRLLLETDAPYVAPVPFRGGRAEPWHVIEVYKRISELKGVDGDLLQAQLIANVQELYKW